MKTVFISCRIRGDTEANLWDGHKYYEYALQQGVAPLMPHLLLANGILDDNVPAQRNKGIQICNQILRKADEVWAVVDGIDGISEGMRAEIELELELAKPVVLLSKGRVLANLKGETI